MARPKKQNADYFSHDANARNDSKINVLRNKFGLEGYAVFFMMVEFLTNSNQTEIELDDLQYEIIAADFRIDTEKLKELLEYMIRIGLFQLNGKVLTSVTLKKRLSPVFEKRNRSKKTNITNNKSATEIQNNGVLDTRIDRNDKKEGFLSQSVTETPQKDSFNRQTATESTQSKVKESKVKESKVKESKVNTPPKSPVRDEREKLNFRIPEGELAPVYELVVEHTGKALNRMMEKLIRALRAGTAQDLSSPDLTPIAKSFTVEELTKLVTRFLAAFTEYPTPKNLAKFVVSELKEEPDSNKPIRMVV